MSHQKHLPIFILTVGVFGLLNTEMGVVGILSLIAEDFNVSIGTAGLVVSLFALAIAIAGPTMPLLFSGINQKKVMLLVLGIFVISNVLSVFTSSFAVLLILRVVPALFHPVYISIALTAAANSVDEKDKPKAVANVIMGVSAGMVLGVPLTSYIANASSLEFAFLFFALINLVAFIATLIFVPSIPVTKIRTYGSQISVLKRSKLWFSIFAVIFLNGSLLGVYSYLAEYLRDVTNISASAISIMLAVFGVSTIFGNIVAGKLISVNATKTILITPLFIMAVYGMMFFTGTFIVPMVIIVLVWGVLFAVGNNLSQYWITSAAPEAPEFSNGLFLTSGNLGISFGTSLGGMLIASYGTPYILIVGVLFVVLSYLFILIRLYKSKFEAVENK